MFHKEKTYILVNLSFKIHIYTLTPFQPRENYDYFLKKMVGQFLDINHCSKGTGSNLLKPVRSPGKIKYL